MERNEAMWLLSQHFSAEQAEQVVSAIETWAQKMNNRSIEANLQPFGEARIYIDDGARGMEFVGFATTKAEVQEIITSIEGVYFHIHLWFGEMIVGNGMYFKDEGSLLYEEHGACRGFFRCFLGMCREFVDTLGAEGYEPLQDEGKK